MTERDTNPAAVRALAEAGRRIDNCVRRRATVLDLGGLGLSELPAELGELVGLTELNLAGNRLTAWPAWLARLAGLTRLDVSGNPLGLLPAEVGLLAPLVRLDLSDTALDHLPPEIGRLGCLSRLHLDHNRLAELPPEIGRLTGLTRLHLAGNALRRLPPELAQLTGLVRLDLSGNRLQAVPPEIGAFAALTVLDLSHNPLESLPAEIGRLAKLTVLRLAGCRLGGLPEEIGGLASLIELDVAGNHLESLPAALREVGQLERVFLHDNPALGLPACVSGPDRRVVADAAPAPAGEILGFFFGREDGRTRPLNEVKLVLLGPAGAGKTTVVQTLRDQPFHEREAATVGLARSRWTLEHGGGAVTMHIWDFSGHPATRPLHPWFLGSRCLFLLVLGGGGGREQADAIEWLRMIEAIGAGDPADAPAVVIALNQWNAPGRRPEVDRAALRECFPFIRCFVEMDCKGKKGIPALKEALARELDRMPWLREMWAREWEEARQAVAAAGPRLADDGFRDLCCGHGVTDPAQQHHLAQVLVRLGGLLRDPTDGSWWQPDWLAGSIYPLLHQADAQGGLLTRADVDAQLLIGGGEGEAPRLMRVLEHLGLARAGLPGGGGPWLLPHLQPAAPPVSTDDFRSSRDAVRIRLGCKTHPAGLVERLIARNIDLIEENRGRKVQWRDGLVLAGGGARALVCVDPEHLHVGVTVIGPPAPRESLANRCRSELHELRREFPGIGPVRLPAEAAGPAGQDEPPGKRRDGTRRPAKRCRHHRGRSQPPGGQEA